MRKDRGSRLARGSAIAAFATLVASVAHTIGGGMPPGALTLVLSLAFSIPFAALVVGAPARAGSRAGVIRAAIAAVGAQLALHALYSLGTGAPITGIVTAADATADASAAHRGHDLVALSTLSALPPTDPTVDATMSHHGGWMLAAHAAAAALTVVMIVSTDRVLALLRSLAGGFRRAIVLVAGTVSVVAPRRPAAFTAPVITAARDLHLRSLRHRGPPALAAAV